MDTYGSRSLAVGGIAVHLAAQKVIEKAKRVAAHMLEAAEGDLEFAGGAFRVEGSPEATKTIQEVALAIFAAHDLPDGIEPTLDAEAVLDPDNFSFPHGTHLCAVEVDTETGRTKIRSYVAVDDVGKVINPLIVEGQVHGGVAQGIAQALFEEAVYDAEGNLITGTIVDYLVPAAPDLPDFTTDRTETPATTNPLGVKGVGEAGTIASTPAVVNAIVDALRPFGVNDIRMPCTPERVWRAIHWARTAGTGLPRAPSRTAARRPRPRPEVPHDPGGVRLRAAALGRRGGHRARPGRRGRQGAGRRAEPATAAAAAAGLPDRAGRPRRRRRAARHPAGRRPAGHRRDDHAPRRHPRPAGLHPLPAAGPGHRDGGRPAVRHRGTLGGSLAHADPAGDLPAVALALDAEFVIAGPNGKRVVPAADFFADYLETAVRPGELLVEIRVPVLGPEWGSAYEKFNRMAQAWAIVGVAALVRRDSGTIAEARIGLTNMGPTPVRASATEQALVGESTQNGGILRAAELAADDTDPPGDLSAQPDYRQHLARVLTRRAVQQAAAVAS